MMVVARLVDREVSFYALSFLYGIRSGSRNSPKIEYISKTNMLPKLFAWPIRWPDTSSNLWGWFNQII